MSKPNREHAHADRAQQPGAIEVHRASLDTLAVTIQALHVSGKQMTLAVFRQLPEVAIENATKPWGVVRYRVSRHDGTDLHVVHEVDGRLCRGMFLFGDQWLRRFYSLWEYVEGWTHPSDDIKHRWGLCLQNEKEDSRECKDCSGWECFRHKQSISMATNAMAHGKDWVDRRLRELSMLDTLPQLFIAV